jgi:hypothetical protein
LKFPSSRGVLSNPRGSDNDSTKGGGIKGGEGEGQEAGKEGEGQEAGKEGEGQEKQEKGRKQTE